MYLSRFVRAVDVITSTSLHPQLTDETMPNLGQQTWCRVDARAARIFW
jgi:hypothetical protein